MKVTQYFSDEYLEQCQDMTPDQILRFLDDFRRLHSHKPAPSKLISMKVPEPLLAAFRFKCRERGVKYQTRIKELMTAWVRGDEPNQKE